jgi:hypothetical protein
MFTTHDPTPPKYSVVATCWLTLQWQSVYHFVLQPVEGEKANGGRGGDVGFLDDDDNKQDNTPNIIANSSKDSDEADRYPDKTFFRCGVGFLAWALWGHIPIHNSACMQSDSFCDLKRNASVGRKTTSCAQIRKQVDDCGKC